MTTAEQPGVIQSSHTFSEGYFENIMLEVDSPVGIVISSELAELMLDMMNRKIQIELRGSEESHLAEAFIMTDGALYTWITAPDEHEGGSESILRLFIKATQCPSQRHSSEFDDSVASERQSPLSGEEKREKRTQNDQP